MLMFSVSDCCHHKAATRYIATSSFRGIATRFAARLFSLLFTSRFCCFRFLPRYRVSNFSFDHLERLFDEPLYNIEDINKSLFDKCKSLQTVRVS